MWQQLQIYLTWTHSRSKLEQWPWAEDDDDTKSRHTQHVPASASCSKSSPLLTSLILTCLRLFNSFFTWGNWGWKPVAIHRLGVGRVRIYTNAVLLQNLCSWPLAFSFASDPFLLPPALTAVISLTGSLSFLRYFRISAVHCSPLRLFFEPRRGVSLCQWFSQFRCGCFGLDGVFFLFLKFSFWQMRSSARDLGLKH